MLYGGLFGYPGDAKNPNGKLRLLYEGAPMSFLLERRAAKAQLAASASWISSLRRCTSACLSSWVRQMTLTRLQRSTRKLASRKITSAILAVCRKFLEVFSNAF